jgi:SPASM domain peptide maturase of grasp-with-spasm system
MTNPETVAGAAAAAAGEAAAAAAGAAAAPAGERCFVLFACCIPVRGARRSVVCDLQRQSWHLIPNGLYEILTERRGMTEAQIKDFYEHEYDREIDGYFAFLSRHELGFFTAEPELFPPLALEFETPSRITNAILDVDAASAHDYATIFRQLDDLGCRAVEVRCFSPRRLAELAALLAPARAGRLRSIDLVVAHTPELDGAGLAELVAAETRLNSVTIHSAPAARQETMGRAVQVDWLVQAIDSPACCGQVHPRLFAVNIDSFGEARRFNSCLNRKVAVDARGEIRNCPSLPRSYGNVRDTSLHAAVAQRDFAALWAINKDQIEVCKDCEFRYICTDCRAYVTDAEDRYSKPAKCGYNPYTAEWDQPPGKEMA